MPKQEQHTYSYVDNHGPHALATGAVQSGSETKTISVPFYKLLVQVAGSLGKRYLLVGFTVVATGGETFKAQMRDHDAQLRDLAMATLSTYTMADLEKAGARNRIRTELINGFNRVIGDNSIQELHITEFGIQ